MFVRRVPSVVVLGFLPLFLANCSDDPGSPATGGSTSTAGKAAGGSSSGSGGSSAGTTTGGMATGGTPTAGAAGKPSGGSAGAGTGGSTAGASGSGGAGGGSSGSGGAGGGGGSSGSGGGSTGGTFKLTSTEIIEGMPIPAAHTCTGKGGERDWGVSPSFKWENPPAGTMSYAFFMIDWTLTMGASPTDNGYHSAAWNIPTTVTSLDKGWTLASLGAAAKGINGGYLGPCPPSGTDTYHMIVMAMPMASYTITATGVAGVKSTYNTFKAAALDTDEVTGTYIQP